MFSGFGVKEAAHRIEFAEVESENLQSFVPWVWGWKFVTFCVASADKITGLSRQILFEGLPPQTQDLHGFFTPVEADLRCSLS